MGYAHFKYPSGRYHIIPRRRSDRRLAQHHRVLPRFAGGGRRRGVEDSLETAAATATITTYSSAPARALARLPPTTDRRAVVGCADNAMTRQTGLHMHFRFVSPPSLHAVCLLSRYVIRYVPGMLFPISKITTPKCIFLK